MSEIIRLSNVTKEFKSGKEKIKALSSIDLEVKRGEIIAFVGPSGAGKSTLLHIIGCLERPTSGTVEIFGSDLLKTSDRELTLFRKKRIGFVFQSFNLISSLNILENITVSRIFQKDKRTDLAFELAKKLRLTHRLENKPAELSGGEKQRVAITRSLINEPDLIIADEPTGNLDSMNSNIILKIFKDLNNRGKTIGIATHNRKVADIAERVIEMEDGKIKS